MANYIVKTNDIELKKPLQNKKPFASEKYQLRFFFTISKKFFNAVLKIKIYNLYFENTETNVQV